MQYFEKKTFFNNRKYHNCETQLANVIHDWATAIDNRQHVDIFILDFEKAFDAVPHDLLKSKLHRYGVPKNIMNWIDSFLSNRQQCVVVNGCKSEESAVVSGVLKEQCWGQYYSSSTSTT